MKSPACCIPSNVIWRGQNHGCGSSQKGHMGPSAELPPLQEAWLTLFSLFHAATWHRRPTIRAVCFHPIPLACWQSGSQDYTHIQDYSSLLAVLAIDYYLLSFLQVLRFICSLTQALIRENAAATIKEHGFLKSWQASNNFRLCMTFLYTVLMLVTFQIVDYTYFFKSYLSFLCYQSF